MATAVMGSVLALITTKGVGCMRVCTGMRCVTGSVQFVVHHSTIQVFQWRTHTPIEGMIRSQTPHCSQHIATDSGGNSWIQHECV